MKVTIIGAGNMGGAIARALVLYSGIDAGDITCTARSEASLERMDGGFTLTTDNHKAVKGADLVIFAVKPWIMEEVVKDEVPYMDLERQIVASVAAGVSFEQLEQWLGNSSVSLFRIIPNTAVEVGSGVTFLSSKNASEDQRKQVVGLFENMGYALEVEEPMMAAGTALASCGIAYAMKYIKASSEGGQSLGFDAEQARKIVEYTVKGAADLLLAKEADPQAEIDKVTTPGGMTMKGLAAMDESGFDAAVRNGLDACLK